MERLPLRFFSFVLEQELQQCIRFGVRQRYYRAPVSAQRENKAVKCEAHDCSSCASKMKKRTCVEEHARDQAAIL